jgi:hypothetical protein
MRPEEAYEPDVRRKKVKLSAELQFYGAFTYNFKGLCHVYFKETAEEKKQAKTAIKALNEGRATVRVL